MPAWDASTVIVDSASVAAGTAQRASVDGYHTPAICVSLKDLEGNADDTITVAIEGDAGTYTVDERTLTSTGSYVVDVPQCEGVRVTSSNGTTLSCEARNNPR